MTTYLSVPFRDKTEAKAKGARWDSEARKWFVPIGRDLEPFTSLLPVDPAKLASPRATTQRVSASAMLPGSRSDHFALFTHRQVQAPTREKRRSDLRRPVLPSKSQSVAV